MLYNKNKIFKFTDYYDLNSKFVKQEYYVLNGECVHNDDNEPALIKYYYPKSKYDVYGNVKLKLYYYNGECYKEIKYYDCENETLMQETYFHNNRIHRLENDKPALINYYPEGNIKSEMYFMNGNLHRVADTEGRVADTEGRVADTEGRVADTEGRVADKPATIRYRKNGEIKYHAYYVNGELYREDKPAYIEYYSSRECDGSKIKSEHYYLNNKLHRGVVIEDHRSDTESKPSVIKYYPNGLIQHELYYKDNKIHRDNNLPAKIFYRTCGAIMCQAYAINGCIHNDNGPAHIEYYPSGNIKIIMYYKYNKCNNFFDTKDCKIKPAYIKYSEDGNVLKEKYMINNQLHRGVVIEDCETTTEGSEAQDCEAEDCDKPAYIKYSEDGYILKEKYCVNGIYKRTNIDDPTIIEYNNNGNDVVNVYTDKYGNQLRREIELSIWTK